MLENLNLKQKIIFLIILFIMILFIIYYIYTTLSSKDTFISSSNITSDDDYLQNILEDNTSNFEDSKSVDTSIIVYICGCVKENKNVTLKQECRISDAIDAAGGLTDEADLTNINLAHILEDGEKIYIPKKGESEEVYPTDVTISSNNTNISSQKVNINKATQTELESIPGIGPSTALKIINYRKENGNFLSIEDIKDVSGIGDSKYEQMKNYICIK